MATWQYDIHFIPWAIVDQHPEIIRALCTLEDIDTAPWWRSYNQALGLVKALSRLLPAAVSWNDSIQMWGTSDGDRVEVSWEEGRIGDVPVRIDVRRLSQDFIQGIVNVAREFDVLFFTEENQVVEPTLQGLLNSIKKSDAARFVEDPRDFLIEIEKRRS